MSDTLKSFQTPILFLIFNRPDTTFRVFEEIKKVKPKKLYLSSDGPRNFKEAIVVSKLRNDVLNNVDWDCEVKTLFRPNNLGCGKSVSGSLKWFFENEIEGIVLEDDCLPSQSFFVFCQDLLIKYRHKKDVYMISGDGRATQKNLVNGDYCFVKYPMIWGWAAWSRSWDNYDFQISSWNTNKSVVLNNISSNKSTRRYWREIFDKCFKGEIDTWDYQFAYSILNSNGLCIVPKLNLISNIGFGPDATHTFNINSEDSALKRNEISFPLKNEIFNNDSFILNEFYDSFYFNKPHYFIRVKNKIFNFFLKTMLYYRNALRIFK